MTATLLTKTPSVYDPTAFRYNRSSGTSHLSDGQNTCRGLPRPLQLNSKHEVLLSGGVFPTTCESLFAQQTENDAGTEASHVDSADAALEAPFLLTAVLQINPLPQSG
jgi:hypothetical protein